MKKEENNLTKYNITASGPKNYIQHYLKRHFWAYGYNWPYSSYPRSVFFKPWNVLTSIRNKELTR